jgi:hypothetical protein
MKLGATSDFPDGKLGNDDEGEVTARVRLSHGRLWIDFGKEITWLGLGRKEAALLGAILFAYAQEEGPTDSQ